MCKHSKSRVVKIAIGISSLMVAGSFVWFAGQLVQKQDLLNDRLDSIDLKLRSLEESVEEAKSRIEDSKAVEMDVEEEHSEGSKTEAEDLVQEVKVENTTQETVLVSQEVDTCHSWMTQAGILDQASAYVLIMRESGCNPNAVNRYSGACGIGQQLPCGKWVHTWNDPVGGMIDMQNYVIGRYGSWANALAFSNANGWY